MMAIEMSFDRSSISSRDSIGEALALARDPTENKLLAALSEEHRAAWLGKLDRVDLPLGKVLYEPGNKFTHVVFPTSAIVSLLYVMENGASAEIAIVGNEGIVGVSLFMGGQSTPSRAVVQSAGEGLCLKANALMQGFNRAGPGAALIAALHPSPYHADVADGGMQSSSFA